MSKKGILLFLLMQVMNVVFSMNSVLMKLASILWQTNGLFALWTMAVLFASVVVLCIYAVAWQTVLSKVDLSHAYLNKSTVVFGACCGLPLCFKNRLQCLVFG